MTVPAIPICTALLDSLIEIDGTRLFPNAGLFAPTFRYTPAVLLTVAQLADLNGRFGSRADALIAEHIKRITTRKPKAHVTETPVKTSSRGRPAKVLANPFVDHLGCTTSFGRYPVFAMDIIEGIARLEWHSHGLHVTNKPLSVRRLLRILESLEEVTTATVGELLGIADRHSQRYVKAIELALPRLMKCRPPPLIDDMERNLPVGQSDWEDTDPAPPSFKDLAKLHQDIGLDAIELTTHV